MEISAQTTSSNPKVVIIGGGFGGFTPPEYWPISRSMSH